MALPSGCLESVERQLPYDGPPSPSNQPLFHATGSEAHRTHQCGFSDQVKRAGRSEFVCLNAFRLPRTFDDSSMPEQIVAKRPPQTHQFRFILRPVDACFLKSILLEFTPKRSRSSESASKTRPNSSLVARGQRPRDSQAWAIDARVS